MLPALTLAGMKNLDRYLEGFIFLYIGSFIRGSAVYEYVITQAYDYNGILICVLRVVVLHPQGRS